jgi:hypothetical protein
MNRNFPPQQFRRPEMNNNYVPARVVMALIGQSEKRYMFYREAAMKMEAGFGELAIVFEDEPIDPMVQKSLQNLFGLGDYGKQRIDSEMKYEMHLQGELKRFLMGRPPTQMQMRPPQLTQGAPPGYGLPQGYPQQGYAPPQGYPPGREMFGPPPGPQQMLPPQQPQQPQQPQPIPQYMPEIPPGQLDLRDPKQAAAAVLRAERMPLGPASAQPQQPQQMGPGYVPPGAYGVPPPQAAYGVPQNAYVPPPSQVPVVAGAPETATQIMAQPAVPAVNVPAAQPNGATKNATS